MRDSDWPNLFIIGAPKCGTTSMFRWLSGHPEVCASEPKETWFFADHELDYLNVRPNHRQDGPADYLSCFGQVDEFTNIKMDGSTHYLYSKPALEFLSKISPKPGIIIQLRNPADRIWSHFNYVKQHSGAPINISFPVYVDEILDKRSKTRSLFTDEPWPQYLLENLLSYSNYQQHIRAWLDLFPQDRIRILILEDLLKQERQSLQDIANWIEVDPTYYDRFDFSPANAARTRLTQKIRRYLRTYEKYFPKSAINVSRQIANKSLASFKIRQSNADQIALAKIEEFFEEPNQRLQNEFGLNLSSWIR